MAKFRTGQRVTWKDKGYIHKVGTITSHSWNRWFKQEEYCIEFAGKRYFRIESELREVI